MTYALPYLILINALGLFLMHQDKQQARKRKPRIPEAILLGCCLLGGSFGSAVGMFAFRHKTKKPLFSIGIPVVFLIHLLLILIRLT